MLHSWTCFFGRALSSHLGNPALQHSERRDNGLWIWTGLVNAQNSWFSPPSCLAGVRHVCADLGQPEELMLLKDRVGLSAWIVATNPFTSVISFETLENPMKLCCWNTHRAGKGPEDKCGLAEPRCDCVMMTSLPISFGLRLDPAVCDFVQCQSYYLPTFLPYFCYHTANSSTLEEQPVLGSIPPYSPTPTSFLGITR